MVYHWINTESVPHKIHVIWRCSGPLDRLKSNKRKTRLISSPPFLCFMAQILFKLFDNSSDVLESKLDTYIYMLWRCFNCFYEGASCISSTVRCNVVINTTHHSFPSYISLLHLFLHILLFSLFFSLLKMENLSFRKNNGSKQKEW